MDKYLAKLQAEDLAAKRRRNASEYMYKEMRRYLLILERAESNPAIWEKLTACTGIATLHGYRAAIQIAEEGIQ